MPTALAPLLMPGAVAAATGVILGGDASLWRAATNVFMTDDDFRVAGTAGAMVYGIPAGVQLGAVGYVVISRATGQRALAVTQPGDAGDYRFDIFTDGKLSWGDGTLARDTNLYRGAANILKTDDAFEAGGNIAITAAGAFIARSGPAVGNSVFATRNASQTADQLLIDNTGRFYWGDGTNPYDAILYRSGVGALRTNTDLTVGGDLIRPTVNTSALPTGPADGEEAFFQNAAMATANVMWHLRYRTATAKWEFVGGAPWIPVVSGSLTKTTTAIAALTSGPTLTAPRAGVYVVEATVIAQLNATGANNLKIQLLKNGVATGGIGYWASTAQFDMTMLRKRQNITLASGDVLTIGVFQTATNSAIYTEGMLEMTPVYVT